MIEYIKGEITELTPTEVVLETAGIGYFINISLTTYSALDSKKEAKVYIYEVIREDTHQLYGFLNRKERELFLLLISVSGIGANTARVIMSSYSASEIQHIIANEDDKALNAIKGIGAKTAQRIIVDLKDKILKIDNPTTPSNSVSDSYTSTTSIKQETLVALSMLGYSSSVAQKVVDKILKNDPTLSVEKVIKQALKML